MFFSFPNVCVCAHRFFFLGCVSPNVCISFVALLLDYCAMLSIFTHVVFVVAVCIFAFNSTIYSIDDCCSQAIAIMCERTTFLCSTFDIFCSNINSSFALVLCNQMCAIHINVVRNWQMSVNKTLFTRWTRSIDPLFNELRFSLAAKLYKSSWMANNRCTVN